MQLSRKEKNPFKLISQLFTEGGRPKQDLSHEMKADAKKARRKKKQAGKRLQREVA